MENPNYLVQVEGWRGAVRQVDPPKSCNQLRDDMDKEMAKLLAEFDERQHPWSALRHPAADPATAQR